MHNIDARPGRHFTLAVLQGRFMHTGIFVFTLTSVDQHQ